MSIGLPGKQHELASRVIGAAKKTVIVLIHGGAVAIDAEKQSADAIVDAHDRGVDVQVVSDIDEGDEAGFALLEAAGVPFTRGEVGAAGALSKQQAEAEEETKKAKCVYCYDPDANELVFVEDAGIQVIKEDMINNAPMVPWTCLW